VQREGRDGTKREGGRDEKTTEQKPSREAKREKRALLSRYPQ